jgi:hypothetical protein
MPAGGADADARDLKRLLFTRRVRRRRQEDVRQEIDARDAVRDRILAAQARFLPSGNFNRSRP